MNIKEIKEYEKLEQRNLQLFNWLNESQIENANMRDRLEELGQLDDLIEDGSIKDLFTLFQEQTKRNQTKP
jgi:predicted nuclease with TOPRIM domain|tara:strand:- start:182 stop:394 length:213 start_codon:yes stop_codon:yes gene_type:complete